MKLSRKRHRSVKLPATVPRNPLVVAARQRKAGAHRKSNKALRRAARSRKPAAED